MNVNLKPGKNAQNAALAGAAGAAGAIITLVAVSYAFRVPKELKKFLPNKKTANVDPWTEAQDPA